MDILLILRYRDESLAVSAHRLTLTLQFKVMFLVEVVGDLVRLFFTLINSFNEARLYYRSLILNSSTLIPFLISCSKRVNTKGKSIPLQARRGPEDFRSLRHRDFKTIGA